MRGSTAGNHVVGAPGVRPGLHRAVPVTSSCQPYGEATNGVYAGAAVQASAPKETFMSNISDEVERERIGIHNEAETIRRDRIRWGPIWAGIVTAIGTYVILQLVLIATSVVELADSSSGDAFLSAIAALVAFFIGGVTTGATAMWQGTDDGIIHGIVMWFAALVALVILSAVGSGLALGSFDTSEAFDVFTTEDLNVDEANDDAQEAAGWALLGVALGLAAAAAGGAVGAKLWPKDDVYVETWRRGNIR